MDASVMDNLVVGRADRDRSWWRDRTHELAVATADIKAYDIRVASAAQPVRALSGGNQQKVVVARELGQPGVRLVVAVDPTRGVDIGAAAFIHGRLRQVALEGAAVLLVSADLDELTQLSTQLAVMYRGAMVGTLDRAALRQPDVRTRIGQAMLTGTLPAPGAATTVDAPLATISQALDA